MNIPPVCFFTTEKVAKLSLLLCPSVPLFNKKKMKLFIQIEKYEDIKKEPTTKRRRLQEEILI